MSDGIFHLHHLNNKNESKPVKFSLLQQQLSLDEQLPQNKFLPRATSCLFTDHKISLNANICHCVKHGLNFCSSSDVNSHNMHTGLIILANFLLSILTLCCALTSSTHLLVWIRNVNHSIQSRYTVAWM